MERRKKQTLTEEIHGYFMPLDHEENEDGETDEDDVEDDELMEFSDMRAEADGATYCKPAALKQCLVNFKNYRDRKVMKVRGRFWMNYPWWAAHLTIRATKAKVKYLTGHPGYELRHDDQVAGEKVVLLFLKFMKVHEQHCDIFFHTLESWNETENLTFENLPDLLDRMEKDKDPGRASIAKDIKLRLGGTVEWQWMTGTGDLSKFFRYLPQLMPRQFPMMVKVLKDDKKIKLQDDLDNRPWIFGFSVILTEEYDLCGCEAHLPALQASGLVDKMSRLHQDAVLLYHILKMKRRNGNTYNPERVLQFAAKNEGQKISDWEATCQFLQEIGILVREKHNIFLSKLWEAEMDIVKGTHALLNSHLHEPWTFNFNFNSGDFTLLRTDPDQMHAARLISNNSVVVMSGKGGCGKTQVVSTVFQYAEKLLDKELVNSQFDESQEIDDDILSQTLAEYEREHCGITYTAGDGNQENCQTGIHVKPEKISQEQEGDCEESPFFLNSDDKIGACSNNSESFSSSSGENSPSLLSPGTKTFFPTPGCEKDYCKSSEVPNEDLRNNISDVPCKTEESASSGETGCPANGLPEENELPQKTKDKYKSPHQEEPLILLTAPTGKAANLLGVRSGLPAFTLHQVIYSYWAWRKKSNGADKDSSEWRFRKVQALVVDECSLVSVTTFSSLLGMLLENAKLKKLVLLGDYRQLPSIEPGNFLSDMFKSLRLIDCSVELRTNHRSASELIVKNAGLISSQRLPDISPERNFHLLDVEEGRGEDYLDNDQDQIVRKLLDTENPPLNGPENSQFVAFRRRDCDAINELCCLHYCHHTTYNSKKKLDFQIGDKVCATKNADVLDLLAVDDDESSHEETNMVVEEPNILNATDILDTTTGGKKMSGGQGGKGAAKKKKGTIRVCNGEIFFIKHIRQEIDNRNKMNTNITLKYGDQDKVIEVDSRALKSRCKLRHAWARTIHTYQGSEADTVIYVVGSPTGQNWQHVYTAVTRGKKRVLIIARPSSLRIAVKADCDIRKTSLRDKMEDMLEKMGLLTTYSQGPVPRTPERPLPKSSVSPYLMKTPPRVPGSNLPQGVSTSPSQRMKQLFIRTPEGATRNHGPMSRIKQKCVNNEQSQIAMNILPNNEHSSSERTSQPHNEHSSLEVDSQPFSEWGDSFTEEVLQMENDQLHSPETDKSKTTNLSVGNSSCTSVNVPPHPNKVNSSKNSPSWKRALFNYSKSETSESVTEARQGSSGRESQVNLPEVGSGTNSVQRSVFLSDNHPLNLPRSPKRPISPSLHQGNTALKRTGRTEKLPN